MVSCSLIHKTVKMVAIFVYENLGKHENGNRTLNVRLILDSRNPAPIYLQLNDKVSMFFVSYLHTN